MTIFFDNFCQSQILSLLPAFGISLSSTPHLTLDKQVSVVAMQMWAGDCEEARPGCPKPRCGKQGRGTKKSLGNAAGWKCKEGPHTCIGLAHAPSFLVSPTHLSGKCVTYSNTRRGVLRKQGHEGRGQRAICTQFPNGENTQAPGTQIAHNC